MTQVLEFFLDNYILFLIGAIIILLAIVGYYADKTNFGQGKNSDSNEDEAPNVDINNVGLMDASQKLTNSGNNISEGNKKIMNMNDNVIDDNKNPLYLDSNNIEDNSKTSLINNKKNSNQDNVSLNVNNSTESISDDIMNIEMPRINNEEVTNNKKLMNNKNFGYDIKENHVINVPEVSKINGVTATINKELGKIKNDIILNVAKHQEEKENLNKKEEELKKFNDEFNSVLPEMELINSDLLNEIDDLELGKTQKLDLNDLTKLDDINLPRINSTITEEHEIWKF